MKVQIPFLATALLALAVFSVPAQETLSLREVLDIAGNNNPALLASRHRWIERQHSIALTNGWPNPSAGVMLDEIPASGGPPAMVEYSLSQEIMAPAKLIAMRNMSRSEAGMAGADFQVKQLEIYVAVKQAYYDLLYNQYGVTVMRANLELMRQFYTVAETNFRSGTASLQDTLRSQTEIARMEVEIHNMEAMETMARNRLNYLLGREANEPLSIQEEFSAVSPDFDMEELRRESQNSPAIASMAWEVEMRRNNVSMARAEFWPDFSIAVGFRQSTMSDPVLMRMFNPRTGRSDYSLEMMQNRRNTWKVEFLVMLPLWFGQYRARVNSANAEAAAAQSVLTDMQNMASMELSMAVNEARSSYRLIGLYQNTVIPQAEQAWQTAASAYHSGRAAFMLVMDTLTDLRNAQLDYFKARVDYERALAGLEQIIGRPFFPNGD